MRNSEDKFAIAALVVWLLWALFIIAANVAIVWTILHFVRKYW